MITKISRIVKRQISFLFIICSLLFSVACSDFFDQESDHVIFSDVNHLGNATDTIYSVTGIMNKLQELADRTILLGEVRGDLVTLTNNASSDLRDLAEFNAKDDNVYNVPRDYYAVINNCNYFIAHADTALKNNRNEYIFMKEYAAVKAIRAWTYLQLVLNYGNVPFVTQPILTKLESEADYPLYGIQAVCSYFINDLVPLAEKYGNEYPFYDDIQGKDSRLFWFPINIVLGDLNLWAGTVSGNVANYKEAAIRYYKYISERNGTNTSYPTGVSFMTWPLGSSTWDVNLYAGDIRTFYETERLGETNELITMIPMNSTRAEGNYSELPNLFNSVYDNDYKVSIVPSQNLFNISESQRHCCLSSSGMSVYYAPSGLDDHMSGDLRLYNVYRKSHARLPTTGEQVETQTIRKYSTTNVHIYRRQMLYLRMAEALNLAGYPRMAFQVLSQGLDDTVISEEVYPYYSENDSAWISKFEFPRRLYAVATNENMANSNFRNSYTVGMHTRGSGWTPMNEYYQLPVDTNKTESEFTPILQAYVDSLVLNESALEFAFEGTRFYDIMRYALRQSNPGATMQKIIGARKGEAGSAEMAAVAAKLADQRNWYLHWKGKIGY